MTESVASGPRLGRILAIGNLANDLGLTRVLQSIALGLSRWCEVHYLGLTDDESEQIEQNGVSFSTIPISGYTSLNQRAASLIRTFQPQVVLICLEVAYLVPLLYELVRSGPEPRLVAYIPIDGRIRELRQAKLLASLDCCVLYTRFAEESLLLAAESAADDAERGFEIRTAVIPHGVDARSFRPLQSEKEPWRQEARRARRALTLPDHPELWDGFRVLNANRPYPRKRIDLTIAAFALFARGKPANVQLVLHHSRTSQLHRREIQDLVDAAGITGRVILNQPYSDRRFDIPNADLNRLYNSCDVGINTAMGEGWGLVSFEHALTGAAQIVPEHTVFVENWVRAAEFARIERTLQPSYPPLDMFEVSVEDVARKLDLLYSDQEQYTHCARACYERASHPQFRWSNIVEQWYTLLKDVLVSPSRRHNPTGPYLD